MAFEHASRARVLGVVLLIIFGLVATACGDAPEETSPAADEGEEISAADEEEEVPADESSSDDEPWRLLVYPAAVGGLPLIVGENQGIFEGHGIEIDEIVAQASGGDYPALIAQGQFHIAEVAPPTLVSAVAEGLDLVAIANMFYVTEDYPLVSVMVPGDSDIQSLADLEGKTVGTPSMSGNIWIAFQNSLIKDGIDYQTVEGVQVNHANMADQLSAGQIDAVTSIEPFTSVMVDEGARRIALPYLSLGPKIQGQLYAASRSWAIDNQEKIEDFKRGLDEAVEFILANRDVAAQIHSEFTGVDVEFAANILYPDWDPELDTTGLAEWREFILAVNPSRSVEELDPASLVLP